MVHLPYVTEPPPPTPYYHIIRFFHSSYLKNYGSSNPPLQYCIIILLDSFLAHIQKIIETQASSPQQPSLFIIILLYY